MRLVAAMAMAAVVAASAAAAGIPVRASYGAQVTGDEPHYLLTAISLAEDLSLDVSDEVAQERYRPFHEVPLDPQARPLAGGRLVSPHDPLLAALVAAPVRLGGWVAVKVALCALAAVLAASTVWVAVRRFGAEAWTSAGVAGLFSASAPLAVYGSQVYPEIPAAAAAVACIAALTGRLRAVGTSVLAFGVVALPWLSVKYVPVAATFAGLAVARLWAQGRRRAAGGLIAALVVAGGVFVVAHVQWYGGPTPYASGDHFVTGEFSVVGSEPNYPGRARRLIGLLIDDKFGLVPWQPAWWLALPAVVAIARRLRGRALPLVAPLAAGWLTATFVALTMQGWWFPGRQVIVVLPAVVIAIAWWASGSALRRAATAAAGVLGVTSYGWLVAQGRRGELTWVVDFFDSTAPVYRFLAAVSPDYLDVTPATWALQTAWLAAGAGLCLWAWRSAGAGPAVTIIDSTRAAGPQRPTGGHRPADRRLFVR